ncbi:MAG: hypothetical protein JXR96_21785 [Deltaproteobacteria bacterium]|nr:hypothetical protein [Deltaproteobacteria bacterium]
MARLVLVGTVHLDPQGGRSLRALLDELRPELITVEVSAYAIEFRKHIASDLAGLMAPYRRVDGGLPPGLEAAAAQLELPFEYAASEEWAARRGARLEAVGDSRLSRRLLGRLQRELLTPENLASLAARPGTGLAAEVEQAWQLARRRARRPLDTAAAAERERVERALAKRIRKAGAGELDCVHAGGWEHLEGLCGLLADLAPEPRLLRE